MSIKKLIALILSLSIIVLSCNVTVISADIPSAQIGATACEGAVLTGNYTYTGSLPEGDSIYRWYISDRFFDEGILVEGADELTFNVSKSTVGKFITFAVVPVDVNGTPGDEVRADPVMQNKGYYEDFADGMPEGLTAITTAEGHVQITDDPLGGDDKVLSVYKKPTSSFRMEARLGFDSIASSQSVVDVYLYASDIVGKARLFGVYDDRYGSVLELHTDKNGKLYYRGGSGLIASTQNFPFGTWNHVVIKINGENKTVEATINGENIINGSGTDSWRFKNDGYDNIASYFLNYGNGGTICIKNIAVMDTACEESAQADAKALENTMPYDAIYDFELPSLGKNGSYIYWKSNMPLYITDDGKVTRPAYGSGDAEVVLTAYIINGASTLRKDFTVTVYEGTYPPEARDVTIVQNGARPVTGVYTYFDEDNNPESGSVYQWYVEEQGTFEPVPGANDIIFVPDSSYDGKNLKFGVTTCNDVNVYGAECMSEPFRYVYYDTQNPVALITSVKLNFDGAFEAEYSYLSPDYIEEGHTDIRWYISDTMFGDYALIDGAAGNTYVPEDTDAYYKASVTPVDAESNIGEEVFSDAFMYATADTDCVAAVKNAIALISLPEYTTTDIDLPLTTEEGAYYAWVSSDESVISSEGKITRPSKDEEDITVTLTAYAVSGFEVQSAEYAVTVRKYSEAPVLSDVKLVQYSRPITLEYIFADADGDTESNTLIQWYCKADSDSEFTLIDGANDIRYAPSKDMEGYIFMAKVLPADSTDTAGEWYTTGEHTYVYQLPADPSVIMDKVYYGPLYLEGKYTYVNPDGIAEGESEYSWYVSDALLGDYILIKDENEKTFKYSEEYDGKYIKFSVTPMDIEGVAGETAMSTPVLIEYVGTPETFDDEDVMSKRVYTGWVAGGTASVGVDPTDASNKVLQLTRTSTQSGQMTKIGYHVPEYPNASAMIIEADLYQSSTLNGTWEMFYICDETLNLHGYKLWCSGNNLMSRGGPAEINGVWKEDSSSTISSNFGKNKWHHIKVVLDYENQMMLETSLDGKVVQTNLPFRYNVDSTNMVTSYLQNNFTGTVYMDNLEFKPVFNTTDMAVADAEAITFDADLSAVTANLKLPSVGAVNGSSIVWTSSDESIINTRGKVNRPSSEEGDKKVKLTAHVIKGSDYYIREFDVNVMRILTEEEIVSYDSNKLSSYDGLIINSDIRLPLRGSYGATYTWSSSDENAITDDGKVTLGDVKQDVEFTVTVTRGEYADTKKVTITVAPDYGTNLVIDGGLISSSSKAANPALYAIDNDYSTYWSSLDSAKTPYIVMDMGMSSEVNKMYIADRWKSIKSVRLEASANKSTWTSVNITKNIGTDNISIIEFDKVNARFIRAYLVNDKAVTINELGLFYTETDSDRVSGGINDITLPVGNTVDDDFEVVTELADGTKVVWTSSNEDLIYFRGSKAVVTPAKSNKSVTLIATVTSGGVSEQKIFTVVVEGEVDSSSSGGGGGGSSSGGKTSGGVTSAAGVAVPIVTPVVPASAFTDLTSVPWAVESVNRLASMGVVKGTSSSTFEPERSITREEFATILYRGLSFKTVDINSEFSDVSSDAWYHEPVMQLSALGIIKGVGDGSFGTGRTITRQDMAVMIHRAALALNAEFNIAGVEFADEASVAEYAKAPVNALSGAQIINGVGDGRFNPLGNATRAEATVILARIIDYIN